MVLPGVARLAIGRAVVAAGAGAVSVRWVRGGAVSGEWRIAGRAVWDAILSDWDRVAVAVRGERCYECGGRIELEYVEEGWPDQPGEHPVCVDCGLVQ